MASYGHVRVDCPCCMSPPVAFDSEEGRQRRRKLVEDYRKISRVQVPLSIAAILSGATSIGLTVPNVSWPFLNCFAFINGILMLIGALNARKAGQANLDSEIPTSVKRNVIVHYVFCVMGCTFCNLVSTYSGMGLGLCFTSPGSENYEKCSPVREVKIAFIVVDIVIAISLFILCILGLVLFCKHARSLGFQNRMQTLEDEVSNLRAQVAVLSQNPAAQSGNIPPPAYSQLPQGEGRYDNYSAFDQRPENLPGPYYGGGEGKKDSSRY